MPNQQLVELAQKPIIKKFGKRKVFKDDVWGGDLASMESISTYNKVFRFLTCVIDKFSKYVWFVPLKDKKKVLKLLMLFKRF